MKMKSTTAGQHAFARIPAPEIPRSTFDRGHGNKDTFDAGYLIPLTVDEALPGDTFTCRTLLWGRLATPQTMPMDNLTLSVFWFAIPMRLVWDNFQKFMGEQVDPGDSTDYLIPTIDVGVGAWAVGSIGDHMGIPPSITNFSHSALPFRAYNLVWNEWFRDQNLQDSLTVNRDDGPDPSTDYVLKRRGKRHDYFTSCLPWPQKGDSVELPLGSYAPVVSAGTGAPSFSFTGDAAAYNLTRQTGTPINTQWTGSTTGTGAALWNAPELAADLSAATAATINQLRQAFQIQKLMERDARGGTRYAEIIRSHFGVVSDDARLQRPEYLGGGKFPVHFEQVAATTDSATNYQGAIGSYAVAGGVGGAWRRSFTEHSIILGLVCLHADLNYQQGLERMWSRQTKYDFYWPALAHLGEQAVLNKEIYLQGSAGGTDDDDVFGYQERYAEYRYKPSQIKGLFRAQAAGTLAYWHLAQEFSSLPVLGDTFIQENPPIDRVINVPSEPHMILDSYIDFQCARPMPVYSVPGLIDHF